MTKLNEKKIMVVEDDQFLGSLMTKKLATSGAKVSYAGGGAEAINKIPVEMPDAILLDLLMPEVDGFTVLAKIKSDDKTKNIPVIVFSNLNKKEDVEKAIKLGAVRFISKASLVPDEIVGEIESVML